MRELRVEELRWRCPPASFSFRTTADVRPLRGFVGQKLALAALRTGIEIRRPGYHVFVAGPPASGRTALIRESLRRFMPALPAARDRVYVNNFAAPYRPRLLQFPPGKGEAFVAALDDLINVVRDKVGRLTQEEAQHGRLVRLRNRFERRRQRIRNAFERRAKHDGFVVGQVRSHDGMRPDLLYVFEQKPLAMNELEELATAGKIPAAKLTTIGRSYEARMIEFNTALSALNRIDQEYTRELDAFERMRIGAWLRAMPERLARSYPFPGVAEHARHLRDAILNRLHVFRPRPHDGMAEGEERDRFREYRGNLLFSRPNPKEPPVVFERFPSFSNLFGFIERPGSDDGGGFCDFLDIRPGSLLQADQGFLVVAIADVLQSGTLWHALKNVLRTGSLPIHGPEAPAAPGPVLKPDPIPIDAKVILTGEPYIFDILSDIDAEFRNTFKIRVDLDGDFPLTPRLLRREFPAFLARVTAQEKLLPVNKAAVAIVAEHGVRLAGRNDKFTASLGKLIDLVREADWCARRERAGVIGAKHIRAAVDQAVQRLNLPERRLHEAILNGSILIQTKGKRVGQINGLAVYDMGDYAFGRPSRITVETSMGRSGIINIEREAGMSGGSHDKGIHILTGYLRSRFAQRRPLSLTASVCFEQSYSAVDGDSASSTEVYAILSSLSRLPIRQDIAVTGSVNQKGEVQAIGDVNEKVEGFFEVIRVGRPSGKEGVIIPTKNVADLMLKPEVVEAVRKGRFHIWAVETVEQGIELLTGVKAGRRLANGSWTPGSVFDRVDRRLEELVRGLRHYPLGTMD
jgi:predicted ATP-dependent protease